MDFKSIVCFAVSGQTEFCQTAKVAVGRDNQACVLIPEGTYRMYVSLIRVRRVCDRRCICFDES